jgi:putative phage-type endonuclease
MKTILTDCSNNKPEWLKLRATGVTASDVPTVLGLNPWKTRYALWHEKRKGLDGIFEDFDNESMYWGRKLEAPVAEAVAEKLGVELTTPDALYAHDTLPLLATPDRLIDGSIPVEIKTTSDRYRDQWENGLADYAHCQLAAQMIVLDAPYGYAACLVGGQRFYMHRIERDAVLDEQITAAVVEFWQQVESNTPPALDAGDLALVKEAHPDVSDEVLELDEMGLMWIKTINTCKEEIARHTSHKQRAEAQLLEFLGNARGARGGSWEVARIARTRESYTTKPSTYVEMKIKELKNG